MRTATRCCTIPGDFNVAVRGHRDLAYRQDVLDQQGVAMQVVTLTTPGTHVEAPATAARLAALVNDEFKEAIDSRGKHFTALATLPLNDPAASAKELDRAMRQLGLPGAMLFGNVNGVALSDPRFFPVYEIADDLGAVLYIHPTHPAGVESMLDYWLMPLVGFLFDTTLAAASLVFSGVVERYPRITWALCHLGGAIPYLAERLDRGFYAFKDCRAHIPQPPSTLPAAVLLRHGELRPGRAAAGNRVCGRRTHPGRQRLPAQDRQHSVDARRGRETSCHRRATRGYLRGQRRPGPQAAWIAVALVRLRNVLPGQQDHIALYAPARTSTKDSNDVGVVLPALRPTTLLIFPSLKALAISA